MSLVERNVPQNLTVPAMNSNNILPFVNLIEEKIKEISQMLVSAESTFNGLEGTEPLHAQRLRELEAKTLELEQEFAERFSVFNRTFEQWENEQRDKITFQKAKIEEQHTLIRDLKQESSTLESDLTEAKDLNKRLKKVYKQQAKTIENQKSQILSLSAAIRQFRNDLTAWKDKISHERFMLMSKMRFSERRKDLFSDISEPSSAFSSPYGTEDDEKFV